MDGQTGSALGMSVGATTLAAVTADRAITRRPALTLFRDRPPQVGAPKEQFTVTAQTPNQLRDHGLVVTDFVDRVGGARPVVASDASTHRPEQLLADGLHALACAVCEGRPIPPAVAITYPGHWSLEAVQALRVALSRVPEWSLNAVSLISDTASVLTALQANPGLPERGVIAVCDFGGSGTNVTLIDAEHGWEPIGDTQRSTVFSGDVIDHALLDYVVADLGASGDGPVAVGSLARLRGQCREAKEHLSSETVTEIAGFHRGVWLTRAELDEALRESFQRFLVFVQHVLEGNDIRAAELSAIVAVGGGANIPKVIAGLSERFGVAVVSSPRPQLVAAIGAALRVARGAAVTGQTMPAPVSSPTAVLASVRSVAKGGQRAAGGQPQPLVTPAQAGQPAAQRPSAIAEPARQNNILGGAQWHRRPTQVVVLAALTAIALGALTVLVLRRTSDIQPDSGVLTTTTVVLAPPLPPVAPSPIGGPAALPPPSVEPAPPVVPPGEQNPVPESAEPPLAP